MNKERILLELANGETVLIEANIPPQKGMVERSEVLKKLKFDEVKRTVRTCTQGFVDTFNSFADDVKPNSASVEFGVEVGVESGQLTSYIVDASGKASFKVTLEWELK